MRETFRPCLPYGNGVTVSSGKKTDIEVILIPYLLEKKSFSQNNVPKK
jgi:hypothetical protein